MNIIIIGGGFFGLYLAKVLSSRGYKIVILEKKPQLMSQASYNNQARVHNGYHYPRAILTAKSSRNRFDQFTNDFPDSIKKDFVSYYLIAHHQSNISAKQFESFCDHIQVPFEFCPESISNLINYSLIEKCYQVREYAFDANILATNLLNSINSDLVTIKTATEALKVTDKKSHLEVATTDGSSESAPIVFNCTYANLNTILTNSGAAPIPLKYELTELCLVEPPKELRNHAFTVMCGPFFSFMPFPARNLYSLSHVRYTPHQSWYNQTNDNLKTPRSAWHAIINDAKRFIPVLAKCKYIESIWQIKTILPDSETDDSRPILFHKHSEIPNFYSILGGKIDNVYDVIDYIDQNQILAS